MSTATSLDTQARLFGRYLIGMPPTEDVVARYSRAITSRTEPVATSRALDYALQHPTALPYLDAYLAFSRPRDELRSRLYLAFSILEASPHHTELFLSQQRSAWYLFVMAGVGLRAVFRLLVGTVIAKVNHL